MEILGIDIGGTGIKGAPVEVESGQMAGERFRIPTPHPATPEAVSDVVGELTRHFSWSGPIGCTFPAVVKEGVVHTAANVDKSWIGTDGHMLFQRKTGSPVLLLNDADAAGMAEMQFGVGKGRQGTVILITLGTGIGCAVFYNGLLIPNTELGHLQIRGKDAELRASDRVRDEKGLSWKKWAKRVTEYLNQLEALLWPDLFIIGGGVSKKSDRFLPLLDTRTPVVPARMLNDAGIVGAALAARVLVEKQTILTPTRASQGEQYTLQAEKAPGGETLKNEPVGSEHV